MSVTTSLDTIVRDGKAYISRKSLAILLNVTSQQLINYEKPQRYKNPLQQAFKKGFVYYDLLYAINWYRENVQLKNSPKKDKSYVAQSFIDTKLTDEEEEYYSEFIENLPKELQIAFKKSSLDELEKFVKLEDISKKSFENKIKRGEYISKDDVDRATLEMVVMLKEAMKQIEDGLPRELLSILKEDCKTKNLLDEFEKKINRYFINVMKELNKKAKEVEPSE